MLYRLRTKDGGIDTASSGTFVEAGGATRHIAVNEMQVTATKHWHSRKSGADYPIAWKVSVPSLEIDVSVTTPVQEQELALEPVTYWEGLVDVDGTHGGGRVRGHGYVELTGYAGPVVGLSQPTR